MNSAQLRIKFPSDVDLGTLDTLLDLEDDSGPSLLISLVDLFFESSAVSLQAIESAFAERNHSKLAFEAHALKSAAANLGLESVVKNCQAIEAQAQRAADPVFSAGSLEALKRTFPPLLPFLKELKTAVEKQRGA